MQKRLRVFLDTSAILAGLNSPNRAAGVILSAAIAGNISAIISPDVIEEARRNIPLKFPDLIMAWQSFLLVPPFVTRDPTWKELKDAFDLLPTSDAPILASAITEKPSALVTWNTKHFLRKSVLEAVSFPILTPGGFLQLFSKQLQR